MKRRFLARFSSAFLIAVLCLPAPAHGLRPINAGSEESPVQGELAGRFAGTGMEEAAVIIRRLQLVPDAGRSSEEIVRDFIRQIEAIDAPRTPEAFVNRLTAHREYIAGFRLGDARGRPEESALLQGLLEDSRRVVEHAGEQLGLTPQHAQQQLGWETIRQLETALYNARDSQGTALLDEVHAETLARWFYRVLPRLLIPLLAGSHRAELDRTRALENPFREGNRRSNAVLADIVENRMAAGTLIDDPERLRQEPDLIEPWIRLLLASNIVDYSKPGFFQELARQPGKTEEQRLSSYVEQHEKTPFLWKERNRQDIYRYLRDVVYGSPKPGRSHLLEVMLGDNNGELALTLKLAEVKLSANPNLRVHLILKGDNGVMNDASVEDAWELLKVRPKLYAQLQEYRQSGRFRILRGPVSHGTPLDRIHPRVGRSLLRADAVFVEGEANTVMVNGLDAELYFALRLKSPLVIGPIFGLDPAYVTDNPPAFLHFDGKLGWYYKNPLAPQATGHRLTIEETWARPMRLKVTVPLGESVEVTLPTGEEVLLEFKKGKVVVSALPDNNGGLPFFTHRERSLRHGAVWNNTLLKTLRGLHNVEAGQKRERPVQEGVYFFPLSMLTRELLPVKTVDRLAREGWTLFEISQRLIMDGAKPEQWRAAAPYVFWDRGRVLSTKGDVKVIGELIEIRYQEPSPAAPAAGPEGSSRRRIRFVDGLDIFVTEDQFAPDDSARLFLGLFQQHPDWLEGDLLETGAGAGAMSIFLARHGRRVVGLDVQPQAVADAEFNKANQPDDVRRRLTFGVSDVYQNLAQVTGDPQRRFDAAFFVHPIFIGENFSTSRGEAFKTAAYAGPEGEVVRRAVEGLPRVLKPGKSGFFFAASENKTNLNVLDSDGLRAMLPDARWRMDPTGVTLNVPERYRQGGEYLEGHILYEVFRITPPESAYAREPSFPKAGMEEIDPLHVREAVQGLYQFPDLVEEHFGKDGAQPASWAAFLEAARRESSWTWDGGLGSFWKLLQKTRQGLAYRSLRKLPVPLRLSVGGELVLHNQREGVLLLGENGAEPSLLAIFMTGDSLRGWSRHNRWEWITSEQKNKHTWTYLGGNGDLLVLEFPQGLYAGRVPRKNGQYRPLTTRFPLEWATEVPVHEGSFEGRAFQTEIEGKDQFVPLKGVVRFSRNELMDLRTASLPSNGNLSGSLQKLPAQDLFVDISQLRWRNDWDKDPKRKIALQNLLAAVRTVEDFFVPQFSAGTEQTLTLEGAVNDAIWNARPDLAAGFHERDLGVLSKQPLDRREVRTLLRRGLKDKALDEGVEAIFLAAKEGRKRWLQLQQEKKQEARLPRRLEEGADPEARWVAERLLPVLEAWAKGGFDPGQMAPLAAAGDSLPDPAQKQEWTSLLPGIGDWAAASRQAAPAPTSEDLAVHLVYEMNGRWFTQPPRRLFLLPLGTEAIHTLDQVFKALSLSRILGQETYSLAGRQVPTRLLEALFPAGSLGASAVWIPSGEIILFGPQIAAESENPWTTQVLENQPNEINRKRNRSPALFNATLFLYGILRQKYPNAAAYKKPVAEDLLLEEFWHGLFHTLTEQSAGRPFDLLDDLFLEQFVRSRFNANGLLRGLWDAPLPKAVPGDPRLPEARARIAMGLVELAGQLGKMRTSTDPVEVVTHWLWDLAWLNKRADANSLAGMWAIRLMSVELKIAGPTPLSPANWGRVEEEQLAAAAKKIAQRPAEELRLAADRILRREMNPDMWQWVAQGPFPSIGPAGERTAHSALAPLLDRIAAGTEQKTTEFSVPPTLSAGGTLEFIHNQLKPLKLPVSAMVAAFSLAEYVNNVVEHGKSTQTTLALTWSEEEVRVTVRDNQPAAFSLPDEMAGLPDQTQDQKEFLDLAEKIDDERIKQKKRPGGHGILLIKRIISNGDLKMGEHTYTAGQGNSQVFIFPVTRKTQLPLSAGTEQIFVGTAEPSMDGNNQFYLPAKWQALGDSPRLTVRLAEEGDYRYLAIYPLMADGAALGSDTVIPMDKKGRIRIRQGMAEWAQVGGLHKAVLLGVGDHLELWNKPAWEGFLAAHDGALERFLSNLRAGAEQDAHRWGSWGPITLELRRLREEDYVPLMEAVDRFLRGTVSLDKSFEQSELGYTQIYGIPWMMSALIGQSGENSAAAVDRISFALDWATSLQSQLYPESVIVDSDDLFWLLMGKMVPLAGQVGSTEEGYRRNLGYLAKLLLNLRNKTPEKEMSDFSNRVEPFFSYYAKFPPELQPRSPQGFASHLALFEKLALEGRDAKALDPGEFARLARETTQVSEDIRFSETKERPGIIGFFVEGEGLPFAKLFSLAAADGLSIRFSGIAAREQLDALARGLSPEAVALLRERIVLVDGRGEEAARTEAAEKLRRQVPGDDQAALVTVRVNFLARNLLRQVERYLRMAGWSLAEEIDRRRALALVESA